MKGQPRILIAASTAVEGEAVRHLLSEEFSQIEITLDEFGVSDFERYCPDVLVLAFRNLERAEAFYLGLYRRSTRIQSIHHSAIILCDKSHITQVYEMCRADRFDDYVLMWPINMDNRRIFQAIHRAARNLELTSPLPRTPEQDAEAQRVAELEAMLEAQLSKGREHSVRLGDSIRDAQTRIGEAFSGFSRDLIEGGLGSAVQVKDQLRVREALHMLEIEGVHAPLRSVGDAMKPMDKWVKGLDKDIKAKVGTHREAAGKRPLVLMVDDDAFQCRLMAQILEKENIDFSIALNGKKALDIIRHATPAVILMDVGLPDINGIELTRRIRATPGGASSTIVMITGQSERQVVVESIRAGASDFVVKPFERNLVLEKIHKFTGTPGTPDGEAIR